MNRATVFIIACGATALSCGSGPTVQPSPVIEDPVVNCPADIAVVSHNGQPPTVSFDTPVAVKGSPPVTVACTPGSGTQFQNGPTTVTCEASDSRAHKASCMFSVSVTPVPQLLKTRFMAFGDSLTEGKTTLSAPSVVVVPPLIFNTSASYVEQLNTKLTARYQDQLITIIAEGKGDEEAGAGKLRLPDALSSYSPDALLLLEGTNELLHTTDPTKLPVAIGSAVNALRVMVQTAKGRGVRVFLATVLPMDPVRRADQAAAVPVLNSQIKTLAAQENVTLVDLFAAIPLNVLGSDGLHLQPQGYDIVADEWFKAIIATMEVKAPSLR